MAKKKAAAKKAASKSAAKKAPAKKAEYDKDGNEKPPVYDLGRGESLPGPFPEK